MVILQGNQRKAPASRLKSGRWSTPRILSSNSFILQLGISKGNFCNEQKSCFIYINLPNEIFHRQLTRLVRQAVIFFVLINLYQEQPVCVTVYFEINKNLFKNNISNTFINDVIFKGNNNSSCFGFFVGIRFGF
jgi:hypothetical protein